VEGDPVNFVDPSGMDSILVISDELFFDGQMACTFFSDPEGVVDVTCRLAPLVFERRKDWQALRDPHPPKPNRWCDEDNPINKKVIDFIRSNGAVAEKLSEETGLGAEFILTWAAYESAYGTGKAATQNNNFFGLTAPGGGTGGWTGAVLCGSGALGGFACFPVETGTGNNLLASGQGALTAQGGRYLTPALGAQNAGGSFADIANAIADAGFNTEPEVDYGQKVTDTHTAILRRKDCVD